MSKHRNFKISCLSVKGFFPCHGFIENETIVIFDLFVDFKESEVLGRGAIPDSKEKNQNLVSLLPKSVS